MLVAALTSMFLPVQAIVNGRLGTVLANPLLAALISFFSGTVTLAIVYVLAYGAIPRIPAGVHVPWYLYSGGLLGAVFVTIVLMVIPHIGPANLLAASIVGQLLIAILLDHWGALGVPLHPITLARLSGVVLLFAGTWLIQRG